METGAAAAGGLVAGAAVLCGVVAQTVVAVDEDLVVGLVLLADVWTAFPTYHYGRVRRAWPYWDQLQAHLALAWTGSLLTCSTRVADVAGHTS